MREVQLQIASGRTVEDAVTSLLDYYKGDQGIGSTDGKEGTESSNNSEEETDSTDIKKSIVSNISNREGTNDSIYGKTGIESSFDHKKSIDNCSNPETDHSIDGKVSNESTDAKCNVSMGS